MKTIPSGFATALVIVACGAISAPVFAQTANAKGKISRNFYRIPYGNTVFVTMSQDYIDHGTTPAGDTGSMDMSGAGTPAILAAAAGTVLFVNDTLNGCGCNQAYSPCANSVQIQHANDEVSTYLHIALNSAIANGITLNPPTVVTQGQQIGVEGDVGWTCGSGRAANTSPGCNPPVNTVPVGAGACGPHLHWNVVRPNGERVNPMTCGISNSIYVDDAGYIAAACDNTTCDTDTAVSNLTLNAFGEWRVFQADDQVTASTVTVTNFGSLVLHAGNSVRMTPGFLADAGGYVRAEIGNCNTTAPAVSQPQTAAEVLRPPAIDLSYERQGY